MPTLQDADACVARYTELHQSWDVIRRVEGTFHLPDCMLWAVGWRETGLQLVDGDGGHGHGVFQEDDRSHIIPPGFDSNLQLQAETAGLQLSQNLRHYFGNVGDALCAYNAGQASVDAALIQRQDPNLRTTGQNYGVSTYAHMVLLHATHIRLRGGS